MEILQSCTKPSIFYTEAHFIDDFSIKIQIWWKTGSAVTYEFKILKFTADHPLCELLQDISNLRADVLILVLIILPLRLGLNYLQMTLDQTQKQVTLELKQSPLLCISNFISICMSSKMWYEITYPFPNSNGAVMSLGHHGISNHQQLDCLFNSFLRLASKKTSKLRIAGHYSFPSQRNSNVESVSFIHCT